MKKPAKNPHWNGMSDTRPTPDRKGGQKGIAHPKNPKKQGK